MESKKLRACLGSGTGNEILRLLGSRGAMDVLCIFCCSTRAYRFTEISDMIEGLSTKTLTTRLRELEEKGVLRRTAYNEIPPRVEYSMTERGQLLANSLTPLIECIATWTP
jgi:DNA-binding HxlR family transcriptional regulator